MRMRRMASAAAPKKCARFCQVCCSEPTNRSQASWTRAVGWRVCPVWGWLRGSDLLVDVLRVGLGCGLVIFFPLLRRVGEVSRIILSWPLDNWKIIKKCMVCTRRDCGVSHFADGLEVGGGWRENQ